MIPIYRPNLTNYKTFAIEAINSEWISNHGKFVNLASDKIKEILGAKYCILMNNGTSATYCLYLALKYKYPNIHKIYIPNNVFIAPWNCGQVLYNSSVFEVMKLDSETMNIDTNYDYIMSLESNSSMIIVHNLGNIINVPRLKRIRPDIIFIEDNCEGIFGKYEGIYTSSSEANLASCVSFYGNKTLTTGEGGAFFTQYEDIYNYIKHVHEHGMTSDKYIYDVVAYNFRMTNIQAAFLYDQLCDIKTILDNKRRIFEVYNNKLSDLIKNGKAVMSIAEDNTEKGNWMFNVRLLGIEYKIFENFMLNNGIEIRPMFYDIHCHTHLKHIHHPYKDLEKQKIANEYVMLPSYPSLTNDDISKIVSIIEKFLI
jgi:perosamine synthetase